MALQNVNLAFGILAGGVGPLGALLVFRNILFVIHHHVRREIAIELRSRHFRHLVVIGLLLGVWPVRRSHPHRSGGIHRFLVGSRMIINQRLAEFLDVVILAVLLCQLAHLHFSEIAFDSLFQKGLTGLFRRISSRSEKGRNEREGCEFHDGLPMYWFKPSSTLSARASS